MYEFVKKSPVETGDSGPGVAGGFFESLLSTGRAQEVSPFDGLTYRSSAIHVDEKLIFANEPAPARDVMGNDW
jgi:hypothetical protein